MFNETSYALGYTPGYLGPPLKAREVIGMPGGRPGPVQAYDPIPPPAPPGRCAPIGQTNSIPARPIYPPGCSFEGDMWSPVQDAGVVHTVDGRGPDSSTSTTVDGSSGFDFGSLLSGDIMGIPTWLVLGGAAWFFFFRKGR